MLKFDKRRFIPFEVEVAFTLTPAGVFPGLAVVVLPKTLAAVEGFPGLVVVALPKTLSDGFSIWKEHISVSSTLIMAPALSNSPL